jgi:hypothetical protein
MNSAVNVHRRIDACAFSATQLQSGGERECNRFRATYAHGLFRILKKVVSYQLAITFLVGSLTLLSGCGGGGATFQTQGNKTLGQELQDLQSSYDKGIITQKQYEDTKKRLIKKYTDY